MKVVTTSPPSYRYYIIQTNTLTTFPYSTLQQGNCYRSNSMLCFQCVDDELVEMEEELAVEYLGMVKGILRKGGWNDSIVLLNITGRILRKVIEYCEMKRKGYYSCMEEWEAEFFMDVDKETLFEMAGAACYMEVEGLVGLISEVIRKKIEGMSTGQVQQYLGVGESLLSS